MAWIKLHKKLLDWEWFGDSKMVHLFVYLLVAANYEDKRFNGILVKRGQIITGRLKLATVLGLSEMQIRTCLSKLKSTNEITIKSTNGYSIITICKYDSYQDKSENNNQRNNQQNNRTATNEYPTDNQRVTITKEYKNKRTIEKGEFFDFEKMEVVFPSGFRQPLGKDQKNLLEMNELKPIDVTRGFIN